MRIVRTRTAIAAAAFLAVATASASAGAADPDPWLGRDKALHFAASSTIAAGGYAIGALVFDARMDALMLGGALAAVAGIGKEALDLAGLGDPSWRDLAWDGIGLLAGLAAAWSVDLLVRGVSEQRPLLLSPVAEPRGAGLALRLVF
jgi:putative lipoprotein